MIWFSKGIYSAGLVSEGG